MKKPRITINDEQRRRLELLAASRGFGSAEELGHHLVERSLLQYPEVNPHSALTLQLDLVVETRGYSDRDEAVEHLIERGLRAYEEPASDPAELEARLRGLGYID
jgi:hypothetical protein